MAVDLAQHHPEVSIKDLYDSKFRYPTNGNPRYVAGAWVYELVEKKRAWQASNNWKKVTTHTLPF